MSVSPPKVPAGPVPSPVGLGVGSVVAGRYRLVSLIGRGGMGVVYRAEHLMLKKEVALKLLHAHLREHPRQGELVARFLREAQSLARLDQEHPHIVSVGDCGVAEDGTLYMAMELCEGEPLSEVVARGRLPPSRAVHLIVQVLRALVHAHGRGIIHRDLKPDNIMLVRRDGRDDFVKILDFGIAKLASEAAEPTRGEGEPAGTAETVPPGVLTGVLAELPEDPLASAAPLTRVGVIFGTPEYLAPEQAQGGEVDARTDLYAVGVMLWELLVGRRPFVGETAMQTISLQLALAPDPPSRHVEGLPASLDAVVLRAMAKRPEERFASAEEFLRALDVVIDELVTPRRTLVGLTTPLLSGFFRAPAALGAGLVAEAGRPQTLLGRGLQGLARVLGVRGMAVLVVLLCLLGVSAAWLLARRQVAQWHRPALVEVGEKAPEVPLAGVVERLEQGRSCQERRSAALELIARGARGGAGAEQVFEPLLQAQRRAHGRKADNGCMRRDLDQALNGVLARLRPPVDGGAADR